MRINRLQFYELRNAAQCLTVPKILSLIEVGDISLKDHTWDQTSQNVAAVWGSRGKLVCRLILTLSKTCSISMSDRPFHSQGYHIDEPVAIDTSGSSTFMQVCDHAGRRRGPGISGVGRRFPDCQLASFRPLVTIDFQLPVVELDAHYIRVRDPGPTSGRPRGSSFRLGKQEVQVQSRSRVFHPRTHEHNFSLSTRLDLGSCLQTPRAARIWWSSSKMPA